MLKILVIIDNLDENSSSGAKANLALVQNLICPRFVVTVAHYTRRSIPKLNCEVKSIKEKKLSTIFLLSKLQIYLQRYLRVKLNNYIEGLTGFSLTYLNDVQSIKAFISKNINAINPDLIVTLSEASSFRPHKAMLSFKKYHNRWLAYVHDPYPMHSYPRPYDWVEPGHQQKRNFFLSVTASAKHLGYPSQLLAEWMESYYPLAKGKAIVIPHQISHLVRGVKSLPKYFDDAKFTILHAGSLMSARNPMSLVHAFIQFLENTPEAKQTSCLLFLGKESIYTSELNKLSQKYPQIFSYADNIAFNEVLNMQYAACVNVIIEAKGPISPFLPGKFTHCVQADRPILLLSPHYSESRRLLGNHYKLVAEIDDTQTILQHITNLYAAWKNNGCTPCNLDRQDLVDYMNAANLQNSILKLTI